MNKNVLALAAAAGLPLFAHAGIIIESEMNDSFSTANFAGSFSPPGDAVVIDGGIHNHETGAPDQDWFSFEVTGTAQTVLSVFGRPTSAQGDSYVQLFDSNLQLIASDNDSGLGLYSSFETYIDAGKYYLRISAAPEARERDRQFDYKMVVGFNITPAPSTAMLAGLGGLMVGRRRR